MHVNRDDLAAPTRALLLLMIFLVAWLPIRAAWADAPSAQSQTTGITINKASIAGIGSQNGIQWQICTPPGSCFTSQAAKDQYAQQHNCRFLEDVCTQQSSAPGAPAQDQGFWGSLWSGIKNGVTYGYQFVKGLFEGLKQQVVGIIDLISNPMEVIDGVISLGKAFFNDPEGTIKQLGELLGQEVVDAITKATQCGAYDLGNVIGQNVSPALALKLASRLTKFSGKLSGAVKALKKELKCASFAAGTPVWTTEGLLPIEEITTSKLVISRSETNFADAPRRVENTFSRVAPSHRLLKTDLGTLTVTDEHPLWVQGKGWTEAQEIVEDDVIAGEHGDALVQSNTRVAKSIKVYNFSVAVTHNYFVGDEGIWAHNSKCELPMPYKAPKSPSNFTWGQSDGGPGAWGKPTSGRPQSADWLSYERQVVGAPNGTEYKVPKGDGKFKDFDGYDAERNVLLDAKFGDPYLVTKFEPGTKSFDGFVTDLVKKAAQEEINFSGNAKVEWHSSNKLAAERMQLILDKLQAEQDALPVGPKFDYTKLKVVYTPDIVN